MENKLPPLKEIHGFFTHSAIRGSCEIREALQIDYRTNSIAHGISNSYFKRYLHFVLKELEKAAMRHQTEAVFLTENCNNSFKPQDQFDVHLSNTMLQEKLDVICLWCRKLSEILIDLIGFSRANREEYYRHFLVIEEIFKTESVQKNLKEYYDCDNIFHENKIKSLKKEADLLNNTIDVSLCWYVKNNKKDVYKKSSVNERLKNILPHVESFQKLPLRDYNEAFSKMSASVHPNNSLNESTIHLKHLELSLTRLGILFMHIIFATTRLLIDSPKGGVLERIENLLKSNKHPETLLNKTMINPEIKINDYVLVIGNYLAKVISSKKSKFEYTTFSVRFFEANHLGEFVPTEIVDEFTASELLLLGSHEEVFKNLNNSMNPSP